jgi:hypothetical protein
MGYGGLGVEYILFPEKRLQLMFSGQIGYGRIVCEHEPEEHDGGFFILEPEVAVGIKIMASERVKLGVGYRVATGVNNLPGLGNSDFSGFYGILQLNSGIFLPEARREFLASHEKLHILSGYYSAKFTSLNGHFTWLDGGGTRFIINRKYAIGVSGYRSRKDVDYSGNALSLAYGGIWKQYFFAPLERVHFSIGALSALGGVGYTEESTDEFTGKGMFVFEPDVFVEINLTEFAQLALGVGYRLMFGKLEKLEMWALSSFSGAVQLRFGGF